MREREQGARRPTAFQPDHQQDAHAARPDSRRRGPLRADRPQPGQDQGREAEGGRAETGSADGRAGSGPAPGRRAQPGAARDGDHGRRPARLRADPPSLARPRSAQGRAQRRRLQDRRRRSPGRSSPSWCSCSASTRSRSRWSQPDDFVFAGRIRDKPRERNSVRTRILVRRRSSRRTSSLAAEGRPPLPDGITFHALRRTYAALRAELGEHPAITAAQMGHRDPRMTLRVYTDVPE